MKIEKVKIDNVDEFGARSIEIKTNKNVFSTPTRALTSSESNYKKHVRILDDPYDNPVIEAIAHFTSDSLKKLYTKNGPFGQRKTTLSSHIKGYEDIITKFYPQIKKSTVLSTDDIFTLADLQRYCGFDLISIPDFSSNSPVEKFENLITKITEQFIDPYTLAEPIPYIDMANDEELFRKKVDMVWDNSGTFKAMGIIYRSPLQYYANFKYLKDNSDRDIWIHASGVPRYYTKNWTTSQIHIPQIYGIDTVSILSQPIGGGEISPKPIEDIKRYDKKTLGIIKISEHKRRYNNNLDCNCPVCSGKNLEQLIENYTINHKKEKDNSLLDTWCKIHEVYSSYEEFDEGKNAIRKNEFKNYLGDKEYISSVLSDFNK